MVRLPSIALLGALAALVSVEGTTGAAAFDLQVGNPLTQGNLSVYFVNGNGPGGGGSIMSLDEAATQGEVKIYQQRSNTSLDTSGRTIYANGPVAIENLSAQASILVQVGDLVRGGLQDQIVTRTILIPPGSGRVSIDTLCVDPFRSTRRIGDSADQFAVPHALFPWRLAKLSALAANSSAAAVQLQARDVRQLGVWWSIDSMRSALTQKLGVPLEPAEGPLWTFDLDTRTSTQLAARRSAWTNSLPLSLKNPQLAEALASFIAALQAKADENGQIVGAVFAIDGQIVGADIYRSHELFMQMWPKLLRAYATEALASDGVKPEHPPTLAAVREFLASAEQAPARDFGAGNQLHESDAAIYAVTSVDGAWVYRSYVAKLASDGLTPEGTLIGILESGTVDGRPLASLADNDMIVLKKDHVASVERNPADAPAGLVNARPVVTDRVTNAGSFNDRWVAGVEPARPTAFDAGLTYSTGRTDDAASWFIYLAVIGIGILAWLRSGRTGRPTETPRQKQALAPPREYTEAVARLQRSAAARQSVAPALQPQPESAAPEPTLIEPAPAIAEPVAPELVPAEPASAEPASLDDVRQRRAARLAAIRLNAQRPEPASGSWPKAA